MTGHSLGVGGYVLVLVLLVALTVLTVGVSFVPLTGGWHIVIGLAIGAVKASLVVLFFMHAISSPRLTWAVILVAMFWLLLMFVLMFTDYTTRGLAPHMPGH